MVLLLMAASSACGQVIIRNGQRQGPLPAVVDKATGDTLAMILLPNTYCFNRKRFVTVKREQAYWRMVNDVRKTLPIAKDARRLLTAAYDTVQSMSDKQQKVYFKQLEKELLAQYKPRLKWLNYRQGKLLVRLVDRECNATSYRLIREYMGTRKAFFWQTFGLMFGVSLKGEWDPDGKDKELEDICIQLEQGLI